jgi:copper chaperone NosL
MRLKHIAVAALIVLTGCAKEVIQSIASEPGVDTVCALDGMVLKDYPGPKAQVHYAEGRPDFFCDLSELFATLFAPEQQRPLAALFVQDMGNTSWEKPEAHWIDAKTAFYVIGSKKTGSMGPAYGAFANSQDAEAFAHKEGGRILRFEQITRDMLDHPAHGPDDKMG